MSINYWIFVTNNRPFIAEDAYRLRMAHGLWGIGNRTANRTSLEAGDKVVFYLTSPAMAFAGTATISSTYLSDEERDKLISEDVFLSTKFGARFHEIDQWKEPRRIKPLLQHLDFIRNKQKWGTHLQGGIIRISEADYDQIIGKETDSGMIGVLTHHWAKDDLIDEARELLDRNGDAQSRAPGFVSRETFYSLTDPTKITTMVKWTGNDIYDGWRASPERAAVMTGADALWSQHPESERFQVAD